MTFDNVVVQINEMVETQRDSGTYFEYLARVYFQNKPTYQNEFKNIWMISDVPEVYGIPKADIGVDLVAKKHQVKTDKNLALPMTRMTIALMKSISLIFCWESSMCLFKPLISLIICLSLKWRSRLCF